MARFDWLKYFILAGMSLFFCLNLSGCFSTHNRQVLVVAIASSLQEVIQEIGVAFTEQYPEIDLYLNTSASGVLAQQIENNAPIDIFASADIDIIRRLTQDKKLSSEETGIFAQNQLVLATGKQDLNINSLSDLVQEKSLRVALGNPNTVPAGKYSEIALRRSPKNLDLYSQLKDEQKIVFGENVRQVLTYLINQEVDVGFVYQTDLRQQENLRPLLTLPSALTGDILYGIAPVANTSKVMESRQFIEFLLGEEGQSILRKYGFLEVEKNNSAISTGTSPISQIINPKLIRV